MKHYFIKTYGCQMNVADSNKIAEVFNLHGFEQIPDEKMRWPQQKAKLSKCDFFLVNTCCIREAAENRAFSYINALKVFKKKNPNVIIGICGCIPKEEHIDLKSKFPFVDIIFGPNEIGKLEEFLKPHISYSPSPLVRGKYVTIMTGCDNFCSYCVVPYVRGREYSRPMDEILDEIKGLLDQGVSDITLLGQNVNSYKYNLAKLMTEIENIFALPACRQAGALRFMTSHPRDMSDELIETIKNCPHAARDFHLPLQAGDDEILKKMNRGYNIEYFRGRVKKIKELMPEATITTDIIVGFPGETEEQFNNTLDRVREFRFNAVNMAAYSMRPQTAAAKMPGHLPENIKQERLGKLKKVVVAWRSRG
ncbi:MAG: bifunctional enzyme involved in thiolation and methylation of tRNA [Candidatus Saganbacteria bacterium]|uniref:tRNA-2-methylthio-N(6)-dimethylallyladenosine synthase n=1 Tax=Candidatus Saganbacteria bacterium TaxID=2575572 RepID=A0A833L1F8_UNCSA|nr:MAG: bifunctional enzyme involved in thiolation and methylation of tRNA [Candidatus Saganbacteria bacterium]